MSYKHLYAVPAKAFEEYTLSKSKNFTNVKNLTVDQLNINEADKINPSISTKIQPVIDSNKKSLEPVLDKNEDSSKVENEKIRLRFYPNQRGVENISGEKTDVPEFHQRNEGVNLREADPDLRYRQQVWERNARGIHALREWAEEDPLNPPPEVKIEDPMPFAPVPPRRGVAIARAAQNLANLQNYGRLVE
jgi:hypothetical protein